MQPAIQQPARRTPEPSPKTPQPPIASQQDPSAQPVLRPVARGGSGVPAAGAPVRSIVGQRQIRRDGGPSASTQPAPTTRATASTPDAPGASKLGLAKVAGALAIVLTLIFGLKAVMRRAFAASGAAGPSRAVQMLSRTILSPKQHVILMRVGQRLIVVADSGGRMSPLSEITDPDEVAALIGQLRDEKLSAAAPTFGGLMNRFRHGTEAAGGADGDEAQPGRSEHDTESDGPDDDAQGDPAREEINGLLAKVRLISHQFKGT